MRERPTVRVLLFDPHDRLLMMKGRLPADPGAPGAWFTIGGAIEAEESVEQAAKREIREETGFVEVQLGPVVWRRETRLPDGEGGALLFKERYLVARCPGGEPSRAGWMAWERELIDDIRWWGLAELGGCAERVFPEGLAALAEPLAAGLYPDPPLRID